MAEAKNKKQKKEVKKSSAKEGKAKAKAKETNKVSKAKNAKPVEKKAESKPKKEIKAKTKETKTETKQAEVKQKAEQAKKKEKKPEVKEEKPEKKEKPKKKKPSKPKPKNTVEITDEVKRKRMIISKKIKLPTFRGHFGKRPLRKKSKEKWDKWRMPRGIDFNFKKKSGAKPKTGFETNLAVKGLHPSGFEDILVSNISELDSINNKSQAVRLSGKLGRKKRIEIYKKAKEMKIKVLNRGL